MQRSYAQSCLPYPSPKARFGYNVAREKGRHIEQYDVASLGGHWYLDYTTQVTPAQPAGMTYAQMIRPTIWKSASFTKTIEATLEANPGTLWILGNEPDRDQQDGLLPSDYAIFYHDVYAFLKARDANARIAVAGIVQSTPLRRRYLDMVLTEYQNRYGVAMPVDVWTLHAFILPENYIWGASIPPGLEAYASEGMQYTVDDHDDTGIFQNNIIAFRQWMAARGYRDKPLLITEYGILLSPLHGFPHEKVRTFMLASFDFFLTATDANTGYPADGNRLVQAWSWFSLNYPPYDPVTGEGQNGNLMEPDTAAMLPLGEAYGAYVATLGSSPKVTLAFPTFQLTPSTIILTPTVTTTVSSMAAPLANQQGLALTANNTHTLTLTTTLNNQGDLAACNLTIQIYHQDPQGKQTLLSTKTAATLGTTGANRDYPISLTWNSADLPLGLHKLILTAVADNSATGLPIAQVRQEVAFHVLAEPWSLFNYLPVMYR
ncbi:MAG: hypothetical protein KF832_17885 [Caldilineaceae bacterium]|nr:hypothetical protein [Caldilineaceae bacterium]